VHSSPRLAWLACGLLSFSAACHSAPLNSSPVPDVVAPTPDAPRVLASAGDAPARSSTRPEPSNDDVARTVVSVFGDTSALHPDSATVADAGPVWDIDVRSYETHERVAHYVQLFSNGAREHFVERLSRGTRYEPMIRAKLRANGMPEDLTYLALIESGYDPNAYSRAAAVGMWQFMSSTARDVGLRVDWWMDERRDPVRSTEGAIRFLGFLQKQFGSLYLAAAAYNGGPGRVARGLTRFAGEMEGKEGEDRFFALAEHDYLRAETKNYVPQLIAAALIAKMPARYGLQVDSTAPLAYDTVQVAPGTSLAVIAASTGATTAVMRDLNPSILRGVTPPDTAVWVHVPAGSAVRAVTAMDSLSADDRRGYRTVRVASATTTPAAVADREGVTLKQLRWFNPTLKTTKRGRIVEGQSVRVPARTVLAFARELPDPGIERWGGESSRELTRGGFHVVRKGESIGKIASRYGLSVARLKALNGMKGNRVIAGQTLRVSSTKTASAKSSPKAGSSKAGSSKAGSSKAGSSKAGSSKASTAKKAGGKSTAKSTGKKKAAKVSSSKTSAARKKRVK
jgi:membrane-bound lytic murein transglycosylase D